MSQPIYQQLGPVRSNPPLADADARAHRTSNGVDPKAIEMLKAARNQVIQADKSGGENLNAANRGQNPSPGQAPPQISTAAATPPEVRDKRESTTVSFAEEFVQKLVSIEQEKEAVDEEMAKVEKLWSSVVEKKNQLEDRRNELIKVKDKLKELDKEMDDVLKSKQV